MSSEKQLAEAQMMEHAVINSRNVWMWLLQTNIGDYYITQHEDKDELWIVEDYMGRSDQKAEKAFKNACRKLLK